jgi:hypothetical protein
VLVWFSNRQMHKDWRAIKYLTLGTVILLCVSFLFSMKSPSSHTFYVTLPIAMIYGFYCWSNYLRGPKWRRFAQVCIVSGIIFHVGVAINSFSRVSLYVDRGTVQAAIKAKDFRLLGERRPGARY